MTPIRCVLSIGRHWYLCFCSDGGAKDRRKRQCVIELFDSLGASSLQIRSIMLKYRCTVLTNEMAVQSTSSNLCGLYCIFYILHKIAHINDDIYEIINDSFKSIEKNDAVVTKFLREMKVATPV